MLTNLYNGTYLAASDARRHEQRRRNLASHLGVDPGLLSYWLSTRNG